MKRTVVYSSPRKASKAFLLWGSRNFFFFNDIQGASKKVECLQGSAGKVTEKVRMEVQLQEALGFRCGWAQ